MKKHIKIAKQHSTLDLYFQALKISQELEDIQNNITDRIKSLDTILKRFQHIHQIEPTKSIDTDTFFKNINTNAIRIAENVAKRQNKAHRKISKKLSKF